MEKSNRKAESHFLKFAFSVFSFGVMLKKKPTFEIFKWLLFQFCICICGAESYSSFEPDSWYSCFCFVCILFCVSFAFGICILKVFCTWRSKTLTEVSPFAEKVDIWETRSEGELMHVYELQLGQTRITRSNHKLEVDFTTQTEVDNWCWCYHLILIIIMLIIWHWSSDAD